MYKLLDYDITEYKQLENTLNELSKQGYNPTSLGKARLLSVVKIIDVCSSDLLMIMKVI